jgi:hypothetical protein
MNHGKVFFAPFKTKRATNRRSPCPRGTVRAEHCVYIPSDHRTFFAMHVPVGGAQHESGSASFGISYWPSRCAPLPPINEPTTAICQNSCKCSVKTSEKRSRAICQRYEIADWRASISTVNLLASSVIATRSGARRRQRHEKARRSELSARRCECAGFAVEMACQ